MKIAILEANHWHVPLYLDPLESKGIEVVAVSDSDNAIGVDIAKRFNCKFYSSTTSLLDNEKIDFAFAFGKHSEMSNIAEQLIARRIPFAIEKPCGINLSQVTHIRALAEEADVYCAVPFIFRISDLLHSIESAEGMSPSSLNYMSIRFIAGAPERYRVFGSHWAIDPKYSGGGATMNLATHFIDFFRLITGKEVSRVSAIMNSRTHHGEIEDYSVLTLQTEDGVTGLVETGYSYPSSSDDQREFSFTFSTDRIYAKSGPDRIEIRNRNNVSTGTRSQRLRLETDVYYPLFVKQVLAECRSGAKPLASLRDAEAVIQVLDAAYLSAQQNGVPQVISPIKY